MKNPLPRSIIGTTLTPNRLFSRGNSILSLSALSLVLSACGGGSSGGGGSPPTDTDKTPPTDTDKTPPTDTDKTPPTDTDKTPPTLTLGNDALRVDEVVKTFTVSFNEEIQIKENVTADQLKAGLVQIFKGDTVLDSADIQTIALDGNDATKLVITLATDYTLTNDDYKVTIKDDAITDLVGNAFVGDSTEVDEFVMDIIAPTLASDVDALRVDEAEKTFTVTFSEVIRIKEYVTADQLKAGLVQIFKGDTALVAADIQTIVLDTNDATKLVITLADSYDLTGGNYKVTIKDDVITDKVGNAFVEATTEVYEFVMDIIAPKLSSGGQSLTINEGEKTFTVSFNEEIQLKEDVTEQALKAGLVQIFKDDTALVAADIQTIAVDANDATKLVITLATDYTLTAGNYKVTIKDDAITDLVGNAFVGDSTEVDEFVMDIIAPKLYSSGQSLTINEGKKTFTVWFNENILIKEDVTEQALKDGLVQIFKDDKALAADDIESIAVDSVFWQKLVITLATGYTLTNGNYKVTIKDGAITDLLDNPFIGDSTEVYEFVKDITAPELQSGGDALWIKEGKKTFTVFFNENILIKEDVTEQQLKDELVQIFKDDKALAADDIESIAVDSTNGWLLVIKLADSYDLTNGDYKVTIKDGAITDLLDNDFVEATTETDSVNDSVAPELASDGALRINEIDKTFTVYFNEYVQLKESVTEQHLKDGLVQIFKGDTALVAADIQTIALDENDATKLVITLATDYDLTGGDYKVTIKADAITDVQGNAFVGDSTETDSVNDSVAPVFAGDNALQIDKAEKTFTVSFNEAIQLKEDVTADQLKAGLVQIFKGDTALAADAIESIAVHSVHSHVLVIKLATGYTLGTGKYKVTIKDDAITDLAGNAFVEASTEVYEFVKDITAPELRSGGNALRIDEGGKTFTVLFNEEIQLKKGVTEKKLKTELVQIFKDDTPLAADAIESITSGYTGLVITLATGYTLTDGSNYKVTIKDGAITDLAENAFAKGSTETDVYEFVKDITAPELRSDSDALWIKEGGNTFKVYFSEEIQLKEGVTEQKLKDGLVQIFKDDTPLAADAIESIAVHSVHSHALVITLATGYTIGTGKYKVTIKDRAITDLVGNAFVEATTETEVYEFVKDITAPELRSGGDALFINGGKKTFTVYFSESIKIIEEVTADQLKDGLVQIFKDDTPLAADAIESIAVHSVHSHALVIKLADSYDLTNGDYKVTIKDGAITDLLGNPFVGDSTEEDKFVKDITAPKLASGGDALGFDEKNKLFKVFFTENIKIKEGVDQQQLKDGLVQIFKDDKALAADAIESIEVDSTNGWLLVIKLADSYDLTNGDYKLTIKDGAITDLLDNPFAKATTEVDSLAAPAFADDALIGLTNLEYSDF